MSSATPSQSVGQEGESPPSALAPGVSDVPIDQVPPVAPERTVEETGGFRVTTLSSASCTAEGPGDWTMTAPDRSDRADVMSPDGSLYAGYGIQAVNTALQGYAAAYQPPLNDPELYSEDPATVAAAYGRIIVSAIGGSADLLVEDIFQPNADYLLLSVAGSTHRGAIFFHARGYPGDGFNYSYAPPDVLRLHDA